MTLLTECITVLRRSRAWRDGFLGKGAHCQVWWTEYEFLRVLNTWHLYINLRVGNIVPVFYSEWLFSWIQVLLWPTDSWASWARLCLEPLSWRRQWKWSMVCWEAYSEKPYRYLWHHLFPRWRTYLPLQGLLINQTTISLVLNRKGLTSGLLRRENHMVWIYCKGIHVIDPLSNLSESSHPLGMRGIICISGVGFGPDGWADDSLSGL